MRYNAGAQTVAAGGSLVLPTSDINSDGSIAASGTGGLTLTAGQYLATFVSDATASGSGDLGAVFALNGAPLAFTASLQTQGGNQEDRIALNVILSLTATGTLTVRNNTSNHVVYTNPILTVVKLA